MKNLEGIRSALQGTGRILTPWNEWVSRSEVQIVGPEPVKPAKGVPRVRWRLNRNLLGDTAYTETDESKRIYRSEIQDIKPVQLRKQDSIHPFTYAVCPVSDNQHLLKRLNLSIEDCYHLVGVPSLVLGTYLVPAMKIIPPEPDSEGPLDFFSESEVRDNTIYFGRQQLISSQRRLVEAHLTLRERVEGNGRQER